MNKSEEILKELKEIRRGLGILLLTIIAFDASILPKFTETNDKILKFILEFSGISIILLVTAIILVSLRIWEALQNGK